MRSSSRINCRFVGEGIVQPLVQGQARVEFLQFRHRAFRIRLASKPRVGGGEVDV
jgi:hypothetical protein